MRSKMLSPVILLVLLALFTGKEAWAQNNPPPAPDCLIYINNMTVAGSTSSFPNYFVGCQTWTLQYSSVGFTGLTLTVESANAATTTTPGAFGSYAGTVSTGINPNTNTTGRVTTLSNGVVNIPWIRVTLSGLTGSGTVFGVLYGYKTGYAGSGSGGGGSSNCPQGAAGDIQYYVSANHCGGDGNLTWDATNGLGVGKPVIISGANALTLGTVAFASLPTPTNAMEIYCTDCTVVSGIDNTCAGSGPGAVAERINGAWKCTL